MSIDKTPIYKIINKMYEYQKHNKITHQCVTNTQYLYDCITMNTRKQNINIKCEVRCVYIVYVIDNKLILSSDHVVVFLEGKIYEPSYAIYKLNPVYIFTLKKLNEYINEKRGTTLTSYEKKKLLNNYIEFKKYADDINDINYNNVVITNKEHYNKQADYIKKTIHN